MRIRSLLAVLLLAFSINPVSAQTNIFIATGQVPVPPLLACPQGTGFPTDGCAAAPAPLTAQFQQAAAFQPGGFINATAATSANYMATNCGPSGTAVCRPPWNVAGADYAIGNYTAPSAMLDPATMSLSGCRYSTTASGTGGNILQCGDPVGVGTFAGLIQHVNFGPIGGHGCTALQLFNSAVTSVLIDDVYFFNDTGLCNEGPSNLTAFSFQGAVFSGGITIQNFYMDGNSSTFTTVYGACTPNTQCNPGIGIGTTGNTTIKYGVMRNFVVHQLSPPNGIGCLTIQNSWMEGWAKRGPDSHSEWFDGGQGGTVPCITIDHVMQLPRFDQAQFGPSPVFVASDYPFVVNALTYTNNVLPDSFIGGGTKTATTSGCIGGGYVVGTGCTTAGNTYFETSVTGSIGTGENLPSFGSCSGAAVIINTLIPGPYPSGVISEWHVDGFGSNQFWDNTTTPFTAGPATCSSAPMGANVADFGVLTGGKASNFGTVTIQNNYIDPTSLAGSTNAQNLYSVGQAIGNTAVASGSIATSGGVSTLTTSVAPTGHGVNGYYVVGAGVTGCGGNNLGCPKITAVTSGTTFTLSANVGTVAAEAMTLEPLMSCNSPAVFSGNIDMSGLTNDATMNQWSTTAEGSPSIGC